MRKIVLLVGLLLVSGAQAQTVVWHGPDEATINTPIFYAYSLENAAGLQGHVNVALTATLDGKIVFHTESVHEHDGVFPFAYTPPNGGELVISARIGTETTSYGTIVSGELPDAMSFDYGYTNTDGGFTFQSQSHPQGIVDILRTNSDELIASSLQDASTSYAYADLPPAEWSFQGLLVQPHELSTGVGAIQLTKTDANILPEGPLDVLPDLTSLVDTAAPMCADDVAIVWDPTGAGAEGTPQFQQYSHMRLAWLNHGRENLQYAITDADTNHVIISVAGDHGFATILPPTIGLLNLNVITGPEDGRVTCIMPFEVTANPAAAGTVTLETNIEGNTAQLNLEALADDQAIGHYEFDVRIEHQGPGLMDARFVDLVWAGKLHGHGGQVGLELDNLAPGNYTVRVFPSPQDPTSPPAVFAPGPSSKFEILATDAGLDEGKGTPAPVGIVGLLVLALAIRRRT